MKETELSDVSCMATGAVKIGFMFFLLVFSLEE